MASQPKAPKTYLRVMKLFVIIILFQVSLPISGQIKVYKLLDKTEKGAIDIGKISGIFKLNPGLTLINDAFKPIQGSYTVYRFLCTYQGISYNDEKDFHELLILETDKNNIIVKGYFYELELYDPPSYKAIFQCSGKGLLLKDQMRLNKIKFIRKQYDDIGGRNLHEDGIIRLTSFDTKNI